MVNPGAWEIPNNGLADRCIEGLDVRPNNIPCDAFTFPSLLNDGTGYIVRTMIGPDIIPADTEPAILAMDICEFMDDDDDPSWGFARQENLVFALANEKRAGYDITFIGPDVRQASVVKEMGQISPVNGLYMLAISTGVSHSTRIENVDFNAGGFDRAANDIVTTNTPVPVVSEWTSAGHPAGSVCQFTKPAGNVQDSVMGRFSMQQPTNMEAYSLKIAFYDSGSSTIADTCTAPGADPDSAFVVLSNNTWSRSGSLPSDKNIALDKSGQLFSTFNQNPEFYEICEYRGFTGSGINICPIDEYFLRDTGFEPYRASQWHTIGGSAEPGKPFKLKMTTWNSVVGDPDSVTLIDDYQPVSETKLTQEYGYVPKSDISVESVEIVGGNGLFPTRPSSVSFRVTIKNYGPEPTESVFVGFTPPLGTHYDERPAGLRTWAALPPYQDNSFYKVPVANTLAVGASATVTITIQIYPDSPQDLQFRFSATCASVEKVWANNQQVRVVYFLG